LAGAKAIVDRLRRPLSIYAIVKDLRRGERPIEEEPRAPEYMEGEKGTPQSSIQDGKKGIADFVFVFMKIKPVTEFSRRDVIVKQRPSFCRVTGIKVAARMGVNAKIR
jgi:hypothetical protein